MNIRTFRAREIQWEGEGVYALTAKRSRSFIDWDHWHWIKVPTLEEIVDVLKNGDIVRYVSELELDRQHKGNQ